jgi:hypothetical protein
MAIDKEIWNKAKALFEQGLSLSQIELETNINKTSISKQAKKENWEKAKIQQLKADIKAIDKEKSTLDVKINTAVEKLSKLSDFDITILEEQIQDETGIKSLVFSTANLAIIRANQMLTKNTKTIMSKVDYFEDGKKIKSDYEEKEIPLSMTDYKDSMELTDKASITLGINPRHANTNIKVDNNNTQENNLSVEDISLAIANGLPD